MRDAKGFKQVPPHCTYWSYLKEKKSKLGNLLGLGKSHGHIAELQLFETKNQNRFLVSRWFL